MFSQAWSQIYLGITTMSHKTLVLINSNRFVCHACEGTERLETGLPMLFCQCALQAYVTGKALYCQCVMLSIGTIVGINMTSESQENN